MEEERLRDLWWEARELTLGPGPAIPNLSSPPTPLRFLREFVSQNKPCLISSSSASSWPALRRWAHTPYLLRRLSSSSATVSLHLTPSGRADSLAPHPSHPTSSLCFASPAVVSLPFSRAIRLIEDDNNSGVVAYAQQQNDCFRLEYGGVAGDVEGEMEWAREAFGGDGLEAVNLWIGNGRSETAFHKDHYENLYVVVTGQKHFLLLPPTEVHRMYIRNYPAAVYKTGENCFDLRLELEEPERLVPWCSVDPYPRSLEEMERQRKEFPMYFEGPKPFEVTVKAGEILYLPSMWFHHVRQSPDENGRTIAINYWYDMQFDIKYAYFNFLQSINCRPTASLANGPAEDTCENDFKPNMSS